MKVWALLLKEWVGEELVSSAVPWLPCCPLSFKLFTRLTSYLWSDQWLNS
jgi:hypothetical protein